jgi:hypothetical protein
MNQNWQNDFMAMQQNYMMPQYQNQQNMMQNQYAGSNNAASNMQIEVPQYQVSQNLPSKNVRDFIPAEIRESHEQSIILPEGGYFLLKSPTDVGPDGTAQSRILSLPEGNSYVIFKVPTSEDAAKQSNSLNHVAQSAPQEYARYAAPYEIK